MDLKTVTEQKPVYRAIARRRWKYYQPGSRKEDDSSTTKKKKGEYALMPDVDIDFYDRDNTLKLFKHTPASMIKDGKSREAQNRSVLPRSSRTSCDRTRKSRL